MLIYLACPIDGVENVDTNWLADATARLSGDGHSIYSPALAWTVPSLTTPDDVISLCRHNRRILSLCDVMVARVMPAAFGTIREIEFARASKVPAIVVDHTDRQRLSFHLETWDLRIVTSIGGAVTQIRKMEENRDSAPE